MTKEEAIDVLCRHLWFYEELRVQTHDYLSDDYFEARNLLIPEVDERFDKLCKWWDDCKGADDGTFRVNMPFYEDLYELCKLKSIEAETGIDLKDLFDCDYQGAPYEMEIKRVGGEPIVYFNGDIFYGYYNKELFLDLIKRMLAVYRILSKEK